MGRICYFRRREVFHNFDFDMAEIPFSGRTLALLLFRVVGFGGSRWSSFESTVPVMGDEGFTLVPLG